MVGGLERVRSPYAFGGLGVRSTLLRVRMSFFGSSQCCSGFSPGTDSEPSVFGEMLGEEPQRDLAVAVEASRAVVRVRSCMAEMVIHRT